MPLTLTAPISEAEYRSFNLLPMPTDFTGDRATTLLNQAWATVTKLCNQPLSQTTNTEVYEFPSRNCNMQPSGDIRIAPRYLPIISITSVSYSYGANAFGWTATTSYDQMIDTLLVHNFPFVRGDSGMVQVVYSSGYSPVPDDLKFICAEMAAHLLSGGYVPTQVGSAVLSEWLSKDFWLTVSLYKRVR